MESGADIIETNTFNSTSISQKDYEMEDKIYELNFEGAKLAKEAADKFTAENPDKPRFVAGSLGLQIKRHLYHLMLKIQVIEI